MGGSRGQPPTIERLRALLEGQHGVVARRQLRVIGFGDDAIDARCRSGSLVRVARGVYAAGHGRLTDRGRWTAAVLSCGDGAVLSHRVAAVLWGIWAHPPAVIDVTVPRGGRRSRPGIALHRSGRLGAGQVARRDGIRVTSPARTLVDVAEVVERRVLERALDESQRLRLCSERQLRAGVERNPGRVGAARIAAVLDEHELGSTATVNDFEEAFLALCDGHGIERPEVNVRLGRYRADFSLARAAADRRDRRVRDARHASCVRVRPRARRRARRWRLAGPALHMAPARRQAGVDREQGARRRRGRARTRVTGLGRSRVRDAISTRLRRGRLGAGVGRGAVLTRAAAIQVRRLGLARLLVGARWPGAS